MEQFWVHFWLSWGSFGVILGRLGGCLEFLGGSWAVYGCLGKAPGGCHAQCALLGSIFGSPWGPKVDFWIALGA